MAHWFQEFAQAQDLFEIELVDLADVNLPLFDEPNHPSQKNYVNDHTKAWSAQIEQADAYVIVTPEYNFGTPPALNNALNYLFQEWHYKPVAFVSYGGLSGGTRSVQMTKQTVTTLKMVPIVEAVNLPFFSQHLDGSRFAPPENAQKSALTLLTELHRWATALKPMREQK